MNDDKFQLFMHLRKDCKKTPYGVDLKKIIDDFIDAKPTKEQFVKMIEGALANAELLWAIHNR